MSRHTKRDTFYANSVLPILISAIAERLGKPSLHMSSGLLDVHSNLLASNRVRIRVRRALYRAAMGNNRVNEHIDIFLSCAAQEKTDDAYLLSKLIQERVVRQTTFSKSIRISNFYGPGYLKHRLIPRMINMRLRGVTGTLDDEDRNFLYVSEINRFIHRLTTDFFRIPENIVWCYGAETISIQSIADKICQILPTCYGRFEVTAKTATKKPNPKIPTTDDYFPDLARKQIPFAHGLAETVTFWRQRNRYSNSVRSTLNYRATTKGVRRAFEGGSIAVKEVCVSKKFGRVVMKKASRRLGFEGAGMPKLNAEIEYYEALANRSSLASLAACYPKLLRSRSDAHSVALWLGYEYKGYTVANFVREFNTIPLQRLYQLLAVVFSGGYFSNLHSLNRADGMTALRAYYIDRAVDRLANFSRVAGSMGFPDDVSRLCDFMSGDGEIRIDGKVCRSPLRSLRELRQSKNLSEVLRPRTEGFCSHGDLTILNILLNRESRDMMLVDPRGRAGYWDPVYDLSKLLFSLSGFTQVMANTFRYERHGDEYVLLSQRRAFGFWPFALDARRQLLRWFMRKVEFRAPSRVSEPFPSLIA